MQYSCTLPYTSAVMLWYWLRDATSYGIAILIYQLIYHIARWMVLNFQIAIFVIYKYFVILELSPVLCISKFCNKMFHVISVYNSQKSHWPYKFGAHKYTICGSINKSLVCLYCNTVLLCMWALLFLDNIIRWLYQLVLLRISFYEMLKVIQITIHDSWANIWVIITAIWTSLTGF